MTKVISFISRKGGTGKTTNAINTATTLYQFGYKTILIETDTNYTLNTIRKMELFKHGEKILSNSIHIVGSHENKVVEEIEMLKDKNTYDYIIIDSAGKTTNNATKELCIGSDIVVVPTSLSQSDLIVAFQTIQDLIPAREVKADLQIKVLPNRVHSRTLPTTVVDTLQNLKMEVVLPFVPAKVLFTQLSTIKPIKEYKPIVENIITQKLHGKKKYTKRFESIS